MEGGVTSVHTVEAIKSPIEIVTVYNDRAEVTRKVDVTLQSEGMDENTISKLITSGTHEIVIQGLSSLADKNSVRVSGGSGNATILEVSVSSKWLDTATENKGQAQQLERFVNYCSIVNILSSAKKDLEAEMKKTQEGLERLNVSNSNLLKSTLFIERI
jgi:hypothetical protein